MSTIVCRYKRVGGEKVSAIGLGTWSIRDYNAALAAFIRAFELGIDNVDTAEIYDSGRAEQFVGKLASIVGRENLFITTKMHPRHLTDKYNVLKAGRAALRRMNLDVVDLFLIHWPNSAIPIPAQVRNFEILVDEGVSRYIGVSNFDKHDLAEAVYSTVKHRIAVDQVHYSVYDRWPEKISLLEYALSENIAIQAHTPLERGSIASSSGDVLDDIGKRVGKTRVQVALNYLLSMGNVIPIPKTEKVEHVEEIAGSMGWCLEDDLVEIIRKRLD